METNNDLYKKAKEQAETSKKLFEKGISLKSEFEKLTYPEKLKFMDKYFGGASAAGEDHNAVKDESSTEGEDKKSHFPPIINVWPKEGDHCQIRLYNEWKIKLFESLEPALSVDFSFERLKKGFEDHISDVKKEKHPELSITKYTQDQIREYTEKVNSSYIQEQFNEYGGAWDTSKKVIPNLIPFLKARAYYNYISFLENQPDKLTDTKEPIIEKECLISIHWKFNKEIREDQDQWIKRFIFPNGPEVNPIDIDKKALKGSNKIILLAILAAIRPYKKDEFDYNDFVFDRFGIKNYYKTKSDYKTESEFLKTLDECNAILIK